MLTRISISPLRSLWIAIACGRLGFTSARISSGVFTSELLIRARTVGRGALTVPAATVTHVLTTGVPAVGCCVATALEARRIASQVVSIRVSRSASLRVLPSYATISRAFRRSSLTPISSLLSASSSIVRNSLIWVSFCVI